MSEKLPSWWKDSAHSTSKQLQVSAASNQVVRAAIFKLMQHKITLAPLFNSWLYIVTNFLQSYSWTRITYVAVMLQGSIASLPSCDTGLTQMPQYGELYPTQQLDVETAFLAEINSPVQLTWPHHPQKTLTKNQPLFIYMEESQLALFPHHETLAQAAGASRACWSWHQFPPLKLCKGPAVTQGRSILGWSAWVPREWLEIILTGWTQFLPIPAFQRRSYFWVMLYKHQTQQKEIPHSWKRWGNDTSDTVWGPAARERC